MSWERLFTATFLHFVSHCFSYSYKAVLKLVPTLLIFEEKIVSNFLLPANYPRLPSMSLNYPAITRRV